MNKLALILALTALPALAQPRKIPVKEVTGKVLVWAPWSSSWAPAAAGQDLWEGTLVQVTDGASITYTMKASEGFSGLESDVVDVTMNKPTVFRIDPQVMRKVTLSTFFIPQLPDITQAEGAKGNLLYEKFNEAWERFAALVLPGNVKQSWINNLKQDETQDASVSAKSKHIRLFAPTDQMLLVTDKLPVEFTVLWKPIPDPNAEYEVMIWQIDVPRRPPVAVTRFDYYYAKLFKDGDFYVQVATRDGRWQSDVRTIHVMLPAQGRIAHTTNAQMGTNPLPLLLPPDEFRYVVHAMPADVSFSWEAGTLGNSVAYQFVLKDRDGKELVRRMTSERLLRLKINRPGDYKWQIEGIPQPNSRGPVSSKVYSEPRLFHLQTAADLAVKPIFNVFDDMLASGKSAMIYAEEGF